VTTDDTLVEVIPESVARSRIAELGSQLAADYADRRPVLVAVLQGALPFVADLIRSMDIELEVDFLALTRFGEGGRVRIAMDTETSLEGRHVLLVEDVVDTGLSLTVLRRLIAARDVASLATATLFDKAVRRIVEVPLEYRGFEVGDEFLLGYGLDWEGRFRNLKSVWAVLDLVTFQFEPQRFASRLFRPPGDNLLT
jgi:hypoxanthine phosphoribosyltransferase